MSHTPSDLLLTASAALRELDDRVPAREGEVRVEVGAQQARVLLCNPRAHNALTVGMMRQLAEAVLDLHSFEGSTIVVASGHGGTFCSGGHLTQVRESLVRPDLAETMTRSMAVVLDALLALPAVSIAVVQGAAIGGGAEICTACDLRIASPGARFHFAQARLGVAAGWGGASRLVQQVGRATAMHLLAGARPMSAQRALQVGLVQHVGDGGIDGLVDAVIDGSQVQALRAVKRQVVGSGDAQQQADAFLQVWGGAAHLKALTR